MPTNGPADRRLQQQRVAEMLRHLGLAPNGQPLAEAPGSLLRGRVDSPRYEPDIVQLQRASRAEARSRAPGAGTFVELKPNAPKDGPASSPKMLLERGQARNAELRREAAAEASITSHKLPECAQDFLRGKIATDPADITLYRGGGGIPNLFNNSVTYGQDIHLTDKMFDRRDLNAIEHKFHEIKHVDQNARMGLNSFDHFAPYLAFLGHDASPLEGSADDFGRKMRQAYKDAGLAGKCPF